MVEVKVDDEQIYVAIQRLMALGRDTSHLMKDIAALGEESTEARFRTQIGPDGETWKPSIRAQITGGKTLKKDGHLVNSISSRFSRDSATWGVGMKYGAIHQFGGIIRPKNKDALKFKIPGGGFAVVKAVKMPARPYLGLSEGDRNDILDLIERRISV